MFNKQKPKESLLDDRVAALVRARDKGKARFHEPDVTYERMTPMMQKYLDDTGLQLVKLCQRSIIDETKRQNILGAMTPSAPGYFMTERDFELQRVREQQAVQKILTERELKLSKASRYIKFIPPPKDPTRLKDNHQWIQAVIGHAKNLGIDPLEVAYGPPHPFRPPPHCL